MYYVMSDIHGCYSQFKAALEHWDSNNEELVVIGDSINKGKDSLKVIRELMRIRNEYKNIIILKGNHEEIITTWLLNDPLSRNYYPTYDGIVKSFFGSKTRKELSKREKIEKMLELKDELKFIDSFPLYYEVDNAIFVHAGINLYIDNWKDDEAYILWERDDFVLNDLTPEKRVFFGHTPTTFIHKDKHNHNIWISEDGMKVGIDGRVSMGGQLNALRVDEKGDIKEVLIFK